MSEIIDVSSSCGPKAKAIAAAGVKTIIRYYSRDTARPSKRLTLDEAKAFANAGLRVGVVHEAKRGDLVASFNKDLGVQDAKYARDYGNNTIGQPDGSTIYFAVDFDATHTEIVSFILPYFQGTAEAFNAANGSSHYNIGVYGSGAVCEAVLDAGTAKRAWLAQSKGWMGYKAFLNSGRWAMRQLGEEVVGGVPCDPDVANADSPGIGDFMLGAQQPAAPALTVIARSGLRLRSGPGTEFDVVKLLPLGTKVHPIKTVGDWTMVDLEGDGASDGFASSHFLMPA